MIRTKALEKSVTSYGPKHIFRGLVVLALILMMGTLGYMVIERWPALITSMIPMALGTCPTTGSS